MTARARHDRPLHTFRLAAAAPAGSALVVADLVTGGLGRSFGALSTVAAFRVGALLSTPSVPVPGPTLAAGAGNRPRRRPSPWRRVAERRDGRRSLASIRSMNRAAEQVAGGDSASFVVLDVARALVELLGLRDCRYEAGPGSGVRPVLRHAQPTLYGVSWRCSTGACLRITSRCRSWQAGSRAGSSACPGVAARVGGPRAGRIGTRRPGGVGPAHRPVA